MAQEKVVIVANDGTEFDTLAEAELHDQLLEMEAGIDTFTAQYCKSNGRTAHYGKRLAKILLQYEQSKIVGPEAVFRAEAA